MQQNPPSKEKDKKVRVFALAKELNLESKVLLDYCKELGFAGITNQLNGLEPDQVDILKDRVKKGSKSAPAIPTPAAPVRSAIPANVPANKVQTLPKAVAKPAPPIVPPIPTKPAPVSTAPPVAVVASPDIPVAAARTVEPAPVAPPPASVPVVPQLATPAPVAERVVPAPQVVPPPAAPVTPMPVAVEPATPAAPPAAPLLAVTPAVVEPPTPAVSRQNVIPNLASVGGVRNLGGGVRNLNAARPTVPPSKPGVAAGAPVAPVVPPAAVASMPTTPTAPVMSVPATPVTPVASVPTPPVAPTPVAPVASVPTPPVTPPTPAPVLPPTVAPPRPNAPGVGGPPQGRPPMIPGSPPNLTSSRPPVISSGGAGGAPRAPSSGGVAPPVGAASSQKPKEFLNRAPQVPPPARGAMAPPRTGPSAPPGGSSGGGTTRTGGQPPSGGQRSPAGGPSTSSGGGQGGPRTGQGGPQRPPGPPGKTAGGTVRLTPEMLSRLRAATDRGQKVEIRELAKPQPGAPAGRPPGPAAPGGGPPRPAISTPSRTGTDTPIADDEEEKKKGGVIGRGARQAGRNTPGRGRGPSAGQPAVVLKDGKVDIIEQHFGSRRGPRAALLRKDARRKVAPIIKEGRIEIAPPVNVRSLSEAIGMKTGELSKRLLKETNQLYGVNSPIEFAVAALIAAEKNIELVLKQQKTAEDILLEDFDKREREVDPEKLRPRPPIVTIMGHVDHGKTSLLDKIRSTKVVDTEIGGITQVIRAWSVVHKIEDPETGEKVVERPITFLDTPGHEAFTKMRARGANVTDIAVIVVAATDGVMPQTEEAIAHARAADVRIIVAINKVDMPNANLDRTRRQLYSLNLLPDDMGGDTQFVETSAITGQGIDDLLTAILLEAELNLADELQADPDRPATGTCLEAYMSADEGVMATVLVQQGTLKRGDIILCGSTYGRVRAMYSDMGLAVQEAGPSTPVRVTGLNEVPNADDPFYVVDELTKAQEIAEVRQQKERETQLNKFAPVNLESLTARNTKVKITELKVILKAEARGSVEAIRKELEKLTHEEVRTRVLHAGIGAITESDVQLALTSPADTLVVGFNVTTDDAAQRLAEERDISIHEYQIIYNLVDAVKSALEGRLKPIEEVVHLGRAVVRDSFRISKVGTIAGCYVTSGTIERSARVRVIREGVVVYPPGEKVVGLDSLKRFKDDAKEVREGFECGLKITGYDDIKVNDVIEAFKIETRQRTL